MMSVLVAVNVCGLPEITTAEPSPLPTVGNPEILVGSVKLAFAVTEFAGPAPSVQLGTAASPVVPSLVSTDVVTRAVDIGPMLPPPDITVIVTAAPPSGVWPFAVSISTEGAAATLDPAGASCGCAGKPIGSFTTTAVSTPPNGLNDFVLPPMPAADAYTRVGAKMPTIDEPSRLKAFPYSPLLASSNALGCGASPVAPQTRNGTDSVGSISRLSPTL